VRPGVIGVVGVVAAAGTGAQEAMSLLDRWGVGVACVIGLGGRDLSAAVEGRTAVQAVESLRHDDRVEAILLVSKPPADAVARAVLAAAAGTRLVAAYVGTTAVFELPPTAQVATTLEGGVLRTLDMVGVARPDVTGSLEADVAAALERLGPGRTLVRGLYSGGTLCYESLTILGALLGDVYSNTPLDKKLAVPAPPDAHVCLDLGEEEYTKGRPHPMIDPEARIELLREQGEDPAVAAILLDVVLGHGAHPDPAGQLAPVCAAIHRAGGPQVVAYVLGTHGDPQGFDGQRAALRDAGCVVTETAARACFAAAAIAMRQPSVVRQTW
jgi:FdrA protein